MAYELIYTSAERGLKQGSRGFCTVACTRHVSGPMATLLESLSAYRHIFKAGGTGANRNPVVWSHLRTHHGGLYYNLLSRIADAGLDYSQRTNKIAHHLVLEEEDKQSAGPGELLAVRDQFREVWAEEPRLYDEPRTVASSTVIPVTTTWESLMGDAGWKGVLAVSVCLRRPVCVTFSPQQDVLSLYRDALAMLPPEQRWNATFSTWYTKLPPGIDCLWKAALAGSVEAAQLRAVSQSIFIDLSKPQSVPSSLENDASFADAICQARLGITRELRSEPRARENRINRIMVPNDDIFQTDDGDYPRARNDHANNVAYIKPLPNQKESSEERPFVNSGMISPAAIHAYNIKQNRSRHRWLITILLSVLVLVAMAVLVTVFFILRADAEREEVSVNLETAKVVLGPSAKREPKPSGVQDQVQPEATEKSLQKDKSSSDLQATSEPTNDRQSPAPTSEAASDTGGKTQVNAVPRDAFIRAARNLLDTLATARLQVQTGQNANKMKVQFVDPKTVQACKTVMTWCQQNKVVLTLTMQPRLTFKDWDVDGQDDSKEPEVLKDENGNESWKWSFFWQREEEKKEYMTVTLSSDGLAVFQEDNNPFQEDKKKKKKPASERYYAAEANLYLFSFLQATFLDEAGSIVVDDKGTHLTTRFQLLEPAVGYEPLVLFPPDRGQMKEYEYCKRFFEAEENRKRPVPKCTNVLFPDTDPTGDIQPLENFLEPELDVQGELPKYFSLTRKDNVWTLSVKFNEADKEARPLIVWTFIAKVEKARPTSDKGKQFFCFMHEEKSTLETIVNQCIEEKKKTKPDEKTLAAFTEELTKKRDEAKQVKIVAAWRVRLKNPEGGEPLLLMQSGVSQEKGQKGKGTE
ncbi:MAG: hypothetical protein Q4G68_05870 [Planctomycetia bacterium]|nr:hypothetical protein [Planctomycetia bacterium]